MFRTTFMCAGALLAASPVAQSLLVDLNREVINPGSMPAGFVRSGNLAYFLQHASGAELWATDGTSVGTIAVGLSAIAGIRLPVGAEIVDLDGAGTVVLAVDDGVAGAEPWVARANPRRLERLADIVPGANGSYPRALLRVGNQVLFGFEGLAELWRTDGTVAGTSRVTSLPGPIMRKLAAVAGRAVFTVGNTIWSSDGTAAGTQPVAVSLAASVFTVVGARLAFLGYDVATGHEPWITDGTPAGTRLVADITPGPYDGEIASMATMGNEFVFGTRDGLWSSDGTAAGTRRVVAASTWLSRPEQLTVIGTRCYMIAGDASSGGEPWVADFSLGTLRRLADLTPGPDSSFAAILGTSGSEMLLGARTRVGDNRLQLHRVDSNGVVEALPWSAGGGRALSLGANLILSATPMAGSAGAEPVLVSGRSVTVLRDLAPPQPASSAPRQFASGDGVAFFTADGGAAVGRELWVTDGTAAGTRLFADFNAGPGSVDIRNLWAIGRTAWFDQRAMLGADYQIHAADANGVRPLGLAGTLNSAVSAPRGRGVVVGMTPASAGTPALAISDGTAAGTRALHPTMQLVLQVVRAGEAVFVIGVEALDTELWATDGTVAGTRQLANFTPTGSSTFVDLQAFGDRAVFGISNQPAAGLYVSDGSTAGTVQLARGTVSQVAVADGRIYFVLGNELWVSDGTLGQTRATGILQSSVTELVGAGATLYLVVGFGGNQQLMATEGSAATLRVVYQGAQLQPLAHTASGALVFGDGSSARRYWVTDGSAGGARLLHAALPLSVGLSLVKVDRGVVFAANSAAHGSELWRAGFAELGLGDVAVSGAGCYGALGVPQLAAPVAPRLGSVAFGLRLNGAAPGAGAALWLSGRPAYFELPGGCTVHAAPDVVLPLRTDGAGAATLSLRLPFDPALLGAGAYTQAIVADSQGAAFGVLALSNGLALTIGR